MLPDKSGNGLNLTREKKLLTKHFNVDLRSFGSTHIPDCEDVLSSVISVAEFDDGHRFGGGVLEMVLLTKLQLPVALGPGGLGIRPASYCSIQNQV